MECPKDLHSYDQADDALRESEARFRNTFENAAVGMAHIAPDGTWLRVNRRLSEIVGYQPAELVQITFQDITHPADLENDLGYLQDVLDGKRETYRIDKRYLRKDGKTVWANLTVGCVRKPSGEVDYFISVIQDIGEQRRVHKALAESEARLRAVHQTSPDGFLMYASVRDPVGSLLDLECYYANPAADALFTPESGTLLGGRLHRDTPPEHRAGLFQIFAKVVETGDMARGEVLLPIRPGGLWIRYFAVKVDDGLAVSFAEITSRKQAEFDLRESEARFRAVQQTTPDGFVILHSLRDGDGQITDFRFDYVNPALERIANDKAENIVGLTVRERMPGNITTGTYDRYVEVVETGRPWQGEIKYPFARGDRWFRITAAKVGDGLAISFADITDAKMTEALLQERDQHARSILNNVLAFIGLLSPEGVMLEVNQPALDAAGLERVDVIGAYFWDTYWWSHDPGARETLKDAVRRAARGELIRYDATIRTVGDSRASVDLQLAPTFDEYGNVIEIVPSAVDISERKKAEQHREMLVRELSHRVKNSLATVQTIASHTLREAPDMETFREAFVGRLMAISKCHDLLVETTRRKADLAQLVHEQVRPYAQAGANSQVSMSGPEVVLGAEASHTFGLVLHELATNAAKYGALSTPDGQLDIRWKQATDPAVDEATLVWEERGGPPVTPPQRRGFGSVLIEQSLSHSLGGSAVIEYRPEGLWAQFRFPKGDRA